MGTDVVDMDVVFKHLESKYGYVVSMIVSHSKAAAATMVYLCTHQEVAANVKCFVNVAGRYRMVRIHSDCILGKSGSADLFIHFHLLENRS